MLFLLATILVGTGAILGMLAERRFLRARQPRHDHLVALVDALAHRTSDVSYDVGEYRKLVEAMTDQIAAALEAPAQLESTTATSLLVQMLSANRELQAHLARAETTLQQQSRDIAEYRCEARTDALTLLSNRRIFDEQLSAALASWRTQGNTVGIVLLDIDHFKSLNDTHGHPAGDAVLREIARLLRETAPRGSIVARFGGEEFACIVTGQTLQELSLTSERLREAIERHTLVFDRKTLRTTASCGTAIATFQEDAMSLLKRGDAALYAAKNGGRNAVYLHDGYRCVRSSSGANADAERVDEEESTPDFQEVCVDLRERLSQLVAGPLSH